MTPEQQALIERLYENESLTDNLTDADAQALLKWAEEQIRNETDGELVTAAVSNANQSGAEGVQALLTQASTFLVHELHAREVSAARTDVPTGASADAAAQDTAAPTATTLSGENAGIQDLAAPTGTETPGVEGTIGAAIPPNAKAEASLAPAHRQPAKKRRRSTKRKKK